MKLNFYKKSIKRKLFNYLKLSFLLNLKEKLINLSYNYSIFENPDLADKPGEKEEIIRNNSKKVRLIFYTTLLISYFVFVYFIYRPRYKVSSAFVVNNSSSNLASNFSFPLILGNKENVSISDARLIKTFLHSPQLFNEIELRLKFSEKYKKQFPDIVSGINQQTYFKNKLDFFRRNVKLRLDAITGELYIDTYAFDPNTSFSLNKLLLKKAESFINQLNIDISKKQYSFFILLLRLWN